MVFIAINDVSFHTNDTTIQPSVAGIAIYKLRG